MTLALVLIAAIAAYLLGKWIGYRKGAQEVIATLMMGGPDIDPNLAERFEAQRQAARDGRN